jgi:CHAD domain-containing protein
MREKSRRAKHEYLHPMRTQVKQLEEAVNTCQPTVTNKKAAFANKIDKSRLIKYLAWQVSTGKMRFYKSILILAGKARCKEFN